MAQDAVEIELFVMVDAGGDYAAGKTEEAAIENYESDIGGTPAAMRLVKVLLTVPLPAAAVVRGVVAEERLAGVAVEAE